MIPKVQGVAATPKKVADATSANTPSPYKQGLNNLASGLSNNQPIYDAFQDFNSDWNRDYIDGLDANAYADAASQLRKSGVDIDTGMTGDWLGVDGLDMKSLSEGLGIVSGAYGLYNNIVGAQNSQEAHDKQMEITDQQIFANKTAMDEHTGSRNAFADATRAQAGLGTVG